MKLIYKKLISTIATTLIATSSVFACDIDGDGIDDPLRYDSGTWKGIRSSDGMAFSDTFGSNETFASPGNYLDTELLLGFVSPIDGYWNWKLPDQSTDRISFDRANISYQASMDLNGDGFSDLAKFIDTCSEVERSCYQERVRVNRLLNNVENNKAFQGSKTGASQRGRGPYAFWVMQSDNNESYDECFAKQGSGKSKGKTDKERKKIKRKKRKFRVRCHDALSDELVRTQQIGKIKNRPFGISRADESATIVIWRTVNTETQTLLKFIRENGETTKKTLDFVGEITFGDYLGTGSDQIAIVDSNTGGATIYDPVSDSTSAMSFPIGGTLVSCPMPLQGVSQQGSFMNSNNVCDYGLC